MTKSKGPQARTRHLLKKKPRERGKEKLSKLLREYESGDRVVIKINPSVHKGSPHRRYHGKIGTIVERRGRSYRVNVKQGKSLKEVIVRPEHIEPYRS